MTAQPSLPGNPHHREADNVHGGDAYTIAQALLALAYETRTQTLAILATAPAQEFSQQLRDEYDTIDQRLGRNPQKMVQD